MSAVVRPVVEKTATGINDVHVNGNGNANTPRYNLSGQRVDDSYRGIVISNGKKMMKR
ncbi:MAG: hypothetical protein J6I60_04835 [Bacteroidaceae bacterium]|nr:hypothetical protein [Bacteroidaceae bacterium]